MQSLWQSLMFLLCLLFYKMRMGQKSHMGKRFCVNSHIKHFPLQRNVISIKSSFLHISLGKKILSFLPYVYICVLEHSWYWQSEYLINQTQNSMIPEREMDLGFPDVRDLTKGLLNSSLYLPPSQWQSPGTSVWMQSTYHWHSLVGRTEFTLSDPLANSCTEIKQATEMNTLKTEYLKKLILKHFKTPSFQKG